MLNLNFDLLEKEPTVYGTTEDGMEAIWYRFGHFIYKPWKNMEEMCIRDRVLRVSKFS